ncbi:MAG: efflux RND transporter permease subunit, partial [Bacteroidales bacterium]|nr:efflux RND transporter permease subunit [Bacteroidales bacterium]
WRATFIIVITIPISLIAAFIYLGGTGGSLNIISLSSLSVAIGMVVDDAIVVIENITRHIEKGSRPKSAAVHATNEVAISVIASTLTLLAVFFPLTMVGGQAGVMFEQLGWMVTIIMIVSTVSALTLTPMLASQMLKLDAKHGKLYLKVFTPIERALDKLDNFYSRAVNWTVRNRKKTVIGVVVFFILSLLPIGFIGTEFIPAQDNSVIAVTAELPVGTRIDVTRQTAEQLYATWKEKYPELDMINYTLGQASSSNVWGSMQNNGANIISFNIRLVDIHSRDRSMFAISDSMRLDLQRLPQIRRSNVLAGGGMGMMGGQSTLDLEVFGYDFAETDRIAKDMQARMSKIPGLVNVNISRGDYQPELQVEFDREKLAMNGLNMSTAATYLRNRINGMTASLYREDGEEYTIRVAYSPEHRESIEALENILIYNNQGQSVRLSEVGKVVESFTPPSIERQNRQRIVKVQSTVSGTTIDKAVAEINKELAQVDIPTTVYTQIGGTYVDQQDSFSDLGLLLVLITLLVFIVMASQFESLSYPFIIMLAVPFAFSGVIMAFMLTGATLNMMSFVGIIMLVGIVVKNGIVLVDYINLNRGRGMGIIQSVVQGGKARLRPGLMTTLTTILGMTPMALS